MLSLQITLTRPCGEFDMKRIAALALGLILCTSAYSADPIVLKPDRVFDGIEVHNDWIVVVRGEKIESAGPSASIRIPNDARTTDLRGMTLLPGLIDAHTHVLLHPYNEALWKDQVLVEPLGLRVCRA